MAEVVISVIKITAASVSPATVDAGASVKISAAVIEETTTYSYPTSPVLGDATMMTSSTTQIHRILRKE